VTAVLVSHYGQIGKEWDDENYRKIDLSFHSGFIPGFKIFNT
jgi:hypothetical protein